MIIVSIYILLKEETKYLIKENIMAFSYKSSKKCFNVLTNYGNNTFEDVKSQNTKKTRSISTIINDYNHNMHGVYNANRYLQNIIVINLDY